LFSNSNCIAVCQPVASWVGAVTRPVIPSRFKKSTAAGAAISSNCKKTAKALSQAARRDSTPRIRIRLKVEWFPHFESASPMFARAAQPSAN